LGEFFNKSLQHKTKKIFLILVIHSHFQGKNYELACFSRIVKNMQFLKTNTSENVQHIWKKIRVRTSLFHLIEKMFSVLLP